MVAYNFMPQFVEAVSSGAKRQTIRSIGKRRHAAVGEFVQLYTGQRTKQCRKIVLIDPKVVDVKLICMSEKAATVNGVRLADVALLELAKADGFQTSAEFQDFFAARLPFSGVLIQWEGGSQ